MKRNATVPADFYDALKRQCAASKREVRRLSGWLRRWNDGEQAETDTGNTTLVPNAELVSALRGKPAPRRSVKR